MARTILVTGSNCILECKASAIPKRGKPNDLHSNIIYRIEEMVIKSYLFFFAFVIGLNSIPALVFAEKADGDKPVSIKEKAGLRFRVPEDWPIEKRGGAVAPIPMEEYLSLKFQSVESRLDSIESSLKKFDVLLQEFQNLKKELEDVKKQKGPAKEK